MSKSGSPAEKSGLQAGDLILAINSKRINNIDDFSNAVSGIKGKALVLTNRGYRVIEE